MKPNPNREAAQSLAGRIAQMSDTDRKAMAAQMPVIVSISGNVFSPFNCCMIGSQIPSATVCGGFRQWETAGRMVRKGEKAVYIWAPTVRKAETEGEEPSRYFLLVPIFDVSQTDLISQNRPVSKAAPQVSNTDGFEPVCAA